MAVTPRLGLQYPDENQNPYYTVIKSFFESLDSYVFSCVADRNMILRGGGTISFNSTTGLFSWSSALELVDCTSGFAIQMAASSMTISDGQMGVIDSSRVLSQNVSATISSEPTAGVGPGKIVVFVRNGTKIVFRNGQVLVAGNSGQIVENGGLVSESRFGTVAFSAEATKDVTFSPAMSDANYRIVGMFSDVDAYFFAPAANKLASGFRISVGGAVPITGNVWWKVEK